MWWIDGFLTAQSGFLELIRMWVFLFKRYLLFWEGGEKSLSKSEVKSTDLEASLGLKEVYTMSLLSEQTTFRSCQANLYVFEVQAVSLNWVIHCFSLGPQRSKGIVSILRASTEIQVGKVVVTAPSAGMTLLLDFEVLTPAALISAPLNVMQALRDYGSPRLGTWLFLGWDGGGISGRLGHMLLAFCKQELGSRQNWNILSRYS